MIDPPELIVYPPQADIGVIVVPLADLGVIEVSSIELMMECC